MSARSKYPWYKERLQTKYSKDVNPVLHHKNWTFLKSGLDDFRDGFPPDEEEPVIRPHRGPTPLFTGLDDSGSSSSSHSRATRNYHSKKLSAKEILISKRIPAAERKLKRVLKLEDNLLAHPLALFPNLEQGLNPELFEEVVDILDPDLLDMLGSSQGSSEKSSRKMSSNTEHENRERVGSIAEIEEIKNELFDYATILRKKKNQGLDIKTAELEKHEKKIKNIANQFCHWSESLGEGGPCLEEETIEALFASGYSQAKQASGPVHVIELSSIPPELRTQAGLGNIQKVKEKSLDEMHKRENIPNKYSYGAWYMKPNTWKRKNKSIRDDPDLQKLPKDAEQRKKTEKLHTKIASLHGAKAFRKYLEENSRKKPEFMNTIAKLQDQNDQHYNL